MLSRDDLVALALTSRVVPSQVKPLTASEFWPLSRRADLGALQGLSAQHLAEALSIPLAEADRVAALMERGAALALAVEALEHEGTWTISGLGTGYPARLAARLGDAAPPVLHGVGDQGLLSLDGVGVVGSRDVDPDGAEAARGVAQLAVGLKLPVVSGAARGVDQQAMNAAFEHGGSVVGVLADSLKATVNRPSTRQSVSSGQVCLITPYAPTAGFSPATAMGRNKVIYALSRAVVVIRSDEGTGGTWAGAVEALRKKWTTVLAWTGPGAAAGNQALLRKGALELSTLGQLTEWLTMEPPQPTTTGDFASQLSLPM